MKTDSISPKAILVSLRENREMIFMLIKREVISRYRGSVMGIFWSLIYPIVLLSVYTFVYHVVLKGKWRGGDETKTEFALIFFAGFLVFMFFSECISRATTMILTNVNYVKKVVFPLEVLPYVTIGAALFQLFVSFFVWVVFYFLLRGLPSWTIFYFPLVLFPCVLFIISASWFLAALGVYYRDIPQLINLILSVLMFCTPIFFPLSAVPEAYRSLFYLNPLTFIVEQTRDVLIWGKGPHWTSMLLVTVGYAILTWLSFIWFQKVRKGFADVL